MTDNEDMPLVEKAHAAIVLAAQTYNPSIFTETWLARNDILDPGTLVGVRVFSPEIAQFQTSTLQVLVIPPKMQITFGIDGDVDGSELAQGIATRTVELLPQTPYQALGLNFEFFVAPPNGQGFDNYTRVLFGDGDNGILREFSAPDAMFGRYFSKDYGQARLKLDIKPVQAGPENKDLVRLSFNFHYEVSQLSPEERARQIPEMIENWSSLRRYSESLVELATRM